MTVKLRRRSTEPPPSFSVWCQRATTIENSESQVVLQGTADISTTNPAVFAAVLLVTCWFWGTWSRRKSKETEALSRPCFHLAAFACERVHGFDQPFGFPSIDL